MTKPDIADWAEANLSPPGNGLGLTEVQRSMVEAMAEPGVTVRFLTPAEMRRLRGPSQMEVLLMLAATDAGQEVLVYERARDELRDGAAAAKAAWDARGGLPIHSWFAARRDR